jgi:hypothetical protein
LSNLNKSVGQINRASSKNSNSLKQSLFDLNANETSSNINKKLKRKTISIESDISNYSDVINSSRKKKKKLNNSLINSEKELNGSKSRKSAQQKQIVKSSENKPKDVFEFTDENDDVVYCESLKNAKTEDLFNKLKAHSSPTPNRFKITQKILKDRALKAKEHSNAKNFKYKSLITDRSNSHGGDTASDASTHGSSALNQCGSSNSCSDDDLNENSSMGDDAANHNNPAEIDNDNDDAKSNENSSNSNTNNNDDLAYRNETNHLIEGSFNHSNIKNNKFFLSKLNL